MRCGFCACVTTTAHLEGRLAAFLPGAEQLHGVAGRNHVPVVEEEEEDPPTQYTVISSNIVLLLRFFSTIAGFFPAFVFLLSARHCCRGEGWIMGGRMNAIALLLHSVPSWNENSDCANALVAALLLLEHAAVSA